MIAIRPAAVAGSFYPADPHTLRSAVAAHLATAHAGADRCPKIVLAPHAGYMYSGDVAALAFAPLTRFRDRIRRVVLLGPVHRVPVRGLAAPIAAAFETPLGRIAVDQAALVTLRDLPYVIWSDRPHAPEHALEVQLPFLQTVLGSGFSLLPLVVGQATPAEVAEVLQRLWGGDETLIVISSDLSHYLPYGQAQACDRETAQRILALATDLVGEQACGAAALNGALLAARQHGLRPRLLALRNSADIPGGDHRRVVGYGAIVFDRAEPAAPTADDGVLGPALLQAARRAIADRLGLPAEAAPAVDPPQFQRPGATFVSLHDAQHALRGCVGRLEATRPLGADVRENARAAAFEDSRFAPLQAHEWPTLQVEVSLLGPAEPVPGADEAQAIAALRPGVDGVILQWREHRATFLPQVWERLPGREDFIAALKRKAGLAADFHAPDLRLSRYAVRCFSDRDLAASLP